MSSFRFIPQMFLPDSAPKNEPVRISVEHATRVANAEFQRWKESLAEVHGRMSRRENPLTLENDVIFEIVDVGYVTHRARLFDIQEIHPKKPKLQLSRRCPRCSSENVATERRPNGDSTCGACGFKDNTKYFDSYQAVEDK